MTYDAQWQVVKSWPESNPAGWLGLDPGLLPQCRSSYGNGYKFERLAPSPRSSGLEVRIVCQKGEIYPYSPGWWAWCGQPKNIYKKVVQAAGGMAQGMGGSALPDSLERDEEAVICFPDETMEHVARAVGARRRRSDWVGS